ncbi:MAG: hypothetical protein IJI25_00360 [Eubacterium sp.]|nr:hypothetical protein [Eubacterium sp.]
MRPDAREDAYYDKFGDKSLTEITPEQLETFSDEDQKLIVRLIYRRWVNSMKKVK